MGPSLSPDSAVKAVGHRLRMGIAAPSLGRKAPSAAVAAALRRTALGGLSREEREWAARIERRRAEVAALTGKRTPDETGVFDIRLAVQWMSVPPVLGRLLMCLVRELEPRSVFELGTGFGISAAYQAAGLELNGAGRMVTVDLDPRPAAIAREGLERLRLSRVGVRAGDEGVARAALAELAPVDFAFIDADHRGEAMIAALELARAHLRPGAVVVFDDVASKWEGMRQAWAAVAQHRDIAWTRHLGRIGIVATREA